MNIDDLISTLFKDVVSPDASTPGEMVRASLANVMPGSSRPAPAPMPSAPVMPVQRSAMPAASMPTPMAAGAAPQPAAASSAPSPFRLNPLGSMARGYQSGGLIGGIANMFEEPALLERQQQQTAEKEAQVRDLQNQTVQFLVSKKGMDPTQAALIARDPKALQEYLKPQEIQQPKYERVGDRLVQIGPDGVREVYASPTAGGGGDDKTPGGRAALAASLGLKQGTDAYNSYVMTGRLPREDQQRLTVTDKKAILEADEAVSATEGALASLRRAMELSKTAYDGALAGERGWITSQFGSDAGNDTRELNQVVTEGALQQLKAIFGGMPTEGERKILLEIQGSAEMPQEVRDRIYQRAIALAERRLKFNQDRANELRSGTFYEKDRPQQQPQDVPSTNGGARPVKITGDDHYNQLPPGTRFIDPEGNERVKP
jgi:hypothetical protein